MQFPYDFGNTGNNVNSVSFTGNMKYRFRMAPNLIFTLILNAVHVSGGNASSALFHHAQLERNHSGFER